MTRLWLTDFGKLFGVRARKICIFPMLTYVADRLDIYACLKRILEHAPRMKEGQ